MEVHSKFEFETNGAFKEVTVYICDGCGRKIEKAHMRNSQENRDKRQVNMYDNFGNVRHFCRDCSKRLIDLIQNGLENV